MPSKTRFRNVMVTWFFDEDYEEAIKLLMPSETIKFCCGQCETCPTTKKQHLQLYIELHNQVTTKYFFDLLKKKVHCEERKGTQEQAIDYVTKEETRTEGFLPFFFGKKKGPGHRTDLDSFMDMIEDGHTAKEILLRHRGNALRHINYIKSGLEVYYDNYLMDQIILENRAEGVYKNPYEEDGEELETQKQKAKLIFSSGARCSKVGGNTESPTLSTSI